MANEVFRWILVSIYIEPDNKYYWSNFKVVFHLLRSKKKKKNKLDLISKKDWGRSVHTTPKRNNGCKLPSSSKSTIKSKKLLN